MQTMTQICQILKKKNLFYFFESPDFYDKFQKVAENIDGFFFKKFPYFHF